jgi:integrase
MSPDAYRLDAAGRRITRQQTSEFRRGTPPRNKGRVYPADPPTVEEIVAVMRQAGDHIYGLRMRGLIVVLWRSGMRIHEALLLHEPDLNRSDGSILVRRGKGGKRRIVGMDDWGWEQLDPWLEARLTLPVGPLFCVVNGPTAGRPWSASSARGKLRALASQAGVRRRFAPHQLRHAHAVENAREGLPLNILQRQLGHANLGVTSIYLQGIDSAEVVDAVHARRAPVISATSAIRDAGPPAQVMQAELAKRAPAARRPPAPRPESTAPIVLPL